MTHSGIRPKAQVFAGRNSLLMNQAAGMNPAMDQPGFGPSARGKRK
ncbi:hypothetical protein LHK_01334 [Laribacter hongkongensis HLHK9]|uniref:Uncharacterized protein n=1 Tax=Laribacter hongkongensis (strain HLHK9) TaxID=557598 RepID=C1D784_LARHH|nr:hypothetical protein LHK_01334 [Laribacter hongkongensis HLHK9]